jgi:hypothetical protein
VITGNRPERRWLEFIRVVGVSLKQIRVNLIRLDTWGEESNFGQLFKATVYKPEHKAPGKGQRTITVRTSELDANATHHERFFVQSIYDAVKESYKPFTADNVLKYWGV